VSEKEKQEEKKGGQRIIEIRRGGKLLCKIDRETRTLQIKRRGNHG